MLRSLTPFDWIAAREVLISFAILGGRVWRGVALAVGTLLFAGLLEATEVPDASVRIAALNRAIMMRTAGDGKIYGANEVDPLLWHDSVYFLDGPSRSHVLTALQTVAELSDVELRRCSPAQRALVQNRVWAVFDHVFGHTRTRTREDRVYLQALAGAMAKLALDPAEIKAITDPLEVTASSKQWPEQPAESGGPDIFLPADIAAANGRWVTLGRDDGEVMAKAHTMAFGGRSLFLLRVRFPEGAPGPEAYFKTAADVPTAWLEGNGGLQLNPAMPTLPIGAEFALIRRLAVVDRDGRWQTTRLTLSVQLRRYRATDQASKDKLRTTLPDIDLYKRLQSFSEFALETDAVAVGQPGRMRAFKPDEKHFMLFFAHSFDMVDGAGTRFIPDFHVGPNNTPMQACANCHIGLGLKSINILTFGPTLAGRLPRFVSRTIELEAGQTSRWESQQSEWGALQVFWPVNAEK